jgi:hypothetical protein
VRGVQIRGVCGRSRVVFVYGLAFLAWAERITQVEGGQLVQLALDCFGYGGWVLYLCW